MDIVLISYGVAALGFLLLCFILIRAWRDSPVGPSVMAMSLLSALWAAVIAGGTLLAYPPMDFIQGAELLRNSACIYLLLQLNSLQSSGKKWIYAERDWRPKALLGLIAGTTVALLPALPDHALGVYSAIALEAQLCLWLLTSIISLVLVEQLYRNAGPQERWATKFLCLGLGGIFVYDFFMYAEALLFQRLDADFWRARGFINAVAVPWLAVGIARHRDSAVDVHISRGVVFHSVTLLAVGVYLLCMAIIGYFIKHRGGDWGSVLQLAFLASAATMLAGIILSGRLRARLRVFLNKNFFSYRYDYREEWLKFTQALANPDADTAFSLVSTIAGLVNSESGLLFCRQGEDFRCLANWEMPPPPAGASLGDLPNWMEHSGWVVDFRERRNNPELYAGLAPPAWIAEDESLWLAVPLIFRDRVIGVALLKRSELKNSLDWEDRDLLKTAGRQAAVHLAQQLASQALIEAKQFDAFNRLSAYVVHDLKNILAQQSLIVANADRHRDNPAFVDDMLHTVRNSVSRMQKLMDQMRSGERSTAGREVNVGVLLKNVVTERGSMHPVPTLIALPGEWPVVRADPERLATVFGHIIQNAQEATASSGSVSIACKHDESMLKVVITDTGIGMNPDFVRERLFHPFDSTKGLTGMGIGAFESREYVRQLGGDIQVESRVGAGSAFTVTLPLVLTKSLI